MTISADSIYSETLQSIIDAKLHELERKKDAYQKSLISIQTAYSSQANEAEKVRILKAGIENCFNVQGTASVNLNWTGASTDLRQLIQNLGRFLEQPRFDPSISSYQLQTWSDTLEHYFGVQSSRYEFASLYAKLVTEWLASEGRFGNTSQDSNIPMTESFEELESSAKLQSRQAWEDVVFTPRDTNTEIINAFLKETFGEEDTKKDLNKALHFLHRRIASFEQEIASPGQFTKENLKWTIKGLLSSDLLSDEKRNVLRDFINNDVILSEIGDVLNLRMVSIKEWGWGATVPLVQEKKLAGHYSITMQEDLLQAIFLQYVGVKWSVLLKSAFRGFAEEPGAWLGFIKDIPKTERRRRGYYLGPAEDATSLQSKRNTLYINHYFMTQLQDSIYLNDSGEDGAEEADFSAISKSGGRTKQMARKSGMSSAPMEQMPQMPATIQAASQNVSMRKAKRCRQIPPPRDNIDDQCYGIPFDDVTDDDGEEKDLSTVGLKQGLIRLLQTEIIVNTRLHGEITGFRAQFKSWNSLLPHSTILAVAEFLGVSKTWLRFFEAFLQAPLGFQHGNSIEEGRIRRRGVPGSHVLSDILGEMILFCLDIVINQQTNGEKLWRVHDDLWFWSVKQDIAVTAWCAINKFTDIMGLTLDVGRAGSVRVVQDTAKDVTIHKSLPQDKIRWGFLYLDSRSGNWEIDESLVDAHTEELRKQLKGKQDSVLSWIRAWNAYADKFFITNFGKSAKCLGRSHTEKVLRALERAQRKLFEDDGSHNVVDFLKSILEDRFGITNIPEGYYFFPTELGGLELRNPFINLLLVHETHNKHSDPQILMESFEKEERDEYDRRKKVFETGKVSRHRLDEPNFVPPGTDRDTFMSFEEFARYREDLHYNFQNSLREVYGELLETSEEYQVRPTSDITTAMNLMDKGGVIAQSASINGNWLSMKPYWKWITQMYGGEIVKRFGGLNIVDNGVLPIGMVSLFRSDRVRWKA